MAEIPAKFAYFEDLSPSSLTLIKSVGKRAYPREIAAQLLAAHAFIPGACKLVFVSSVMSPDNRAFQPSYIGLTQLACSIHWLTSRDSGQNVGPLDSSICPS